MESVAQHAKWLEPFLEGDMINLVHSTPTERVAKIQNEGLKIPQRKEDKYWGSDMAAVFASVPHEDSLQGIGDAIVNFKYPISKVNVRPPLISYEPEKYGVKREGIPLKEYLSTQPPEVWNMVRGIEFLILEDISPEYLISCA